MFVDVCVYVDEFRRTFYRDKCSTHQGITPDSVSEFYHKQDEVFRLRMYDVSLNDSHLVVPLSAHLSVDLVAPLGAPLVCPFESESDL